MEATGYLELTIVFVTLIFSVISIVGSVVFRLHYHRKIDLEYYKVPCRTGAVSRFPSSRGYCLFRYASAAAALPVLYG